MKKLLVLLMCALLCSCSFETENRVAYFFQKEKQCFEYLGTIYEYNVPEGIFTVKSGNYEGTTILYTDTGCTALCDDFSISTDPNTFPQLKGAYMLWKAFSCNYESAVITDDGAYALLIDSSRFLVYYNEDAKKIDKLIAETEDGIFIYTVPAEDTIE